MNRYENGKIYKIVDVGYTKCYIGSTTEKLSKRFERHRKYYKRFLEQNVIDTKAIDIFEEYGIDNCKIELIENCPCQTKEELLRREGYHIQNNDCVNKQVAGRTPKEYYEQNKEYRDKQRKEHYQRHKEYYKELNKNYRMSHQEEIQRQRKEYYEQNKEHIKEKRREIFYCDCGGSCWTSAKARHYKTTKHQTYLQQQTEQ